MVGSLAAPEPLVTYSGLSAIGQTSYNQSQCASDLALAACSDGQDGAISVRWRVVDLTTGAIYDLRQQVGTLGNQVGVCFCAADDGKGGGCPGSSGWRVDRVRIRDASRSRARASTSAVACGANVRTHVLATRGYRRVSGRDEARDRDPGLRRVAAPSRFELPLPP